MSARIKSNGNAGRVLRETEFGPLAIPLIMQQATGSTQQVSMLLDQGAELRKERSGIVRAGRGFRITVSIGKEDPSRFVSEGFGGRGGGRHNLDLETMLTKPAQNIVFHAIVIGDNRNVRCRQGFANVSRPRQR